MRARLVSFDRHQCQFPRLPFPTASAYCPRPRIQAKEAPMKRYVIERDLPGVGSMTAEQLKQAAATSNAALAQLDGKAQWVQSFVAADKTFCIYLAESETAVREHARLSGFPASKVTEVAGVIDPLTAN